MQKSLTAAAAALVLSTIVAGAQTLRAPEAPQPPSQAPAGSRGQGTTAHGSPDPQTTQAIPGAANFLAKPTPTQIMGQSLVQQPVYLPDGRGIGEIDDILIDQSGQVAAVIISVGGFVGTTGKRIAVPMTALNLQRPNTPGTEPTSLKVTFAISKDQLERAPNFEGPAGRTQQSR